MVEEEYDESIVAINGRRSTVIACKDVQVLIRREGSIHKVVSRLSGGLKTISGIPKDEPDDIMNHIEIQLKFGGDQTVH